MYKYEFDYEIETWSYTNNDVKLKIKFIATKFSCHCPNQSFDMPEELHKNIRQNQYVLNAIINKFYLYWQNLSKFLHFALLSLFSPFNISLILSIIYFLNFTFLITKTAYDFFHFLLYQFLLYKDNFCQSILVGSLFLLIL